MEKKSVFISYAKEDRNAAIKLYEELKKAGLKPWLDQKDLLPGQNWKRRIELAIKNSNFFIALLSNNSVSKKGYVQKELKKAMEILEEYPYGEGFLIPIRLDECSPEDEKLENLHWVDLFEDYQLCLTKIITAMNPQLQHSKENKEYVTPSLETFVRPEIRIESIYNTAFQQNQSHYLAMEKNETTTFEKSLVDEKGYFNDELV